MFSLIISIIAIALVAALALASIYYGGEAFNKGTADADASTIINQGQQVQAAVTMQQVAKDTDVTVMQDLVDHDYLQEIPAFEGTKWALPTAGGTVEHVTLNVALTKDVCDSINVKAGNVDSSGDAVNPANAVTGLFGCFDDATDKKAFYRVGLVYK